MDTKSRKKLVELYRKYCAGKSPTSYHMIELRALACVCDTVVEFGTEYGRTAVAFHPGSWRNLSDWRLGVGGSARN